MWWGPLAQLAISRFEKNAARAQPTRPRTARASLARAGGPPGVVFAPRRPPPARRAALTCASTAPPRPPAGGAVLAAAEALPRHATVLRAAFEWAATDALRRRDADAPTANVAQFLAASLGQEFLHPPPPPSAAGMHTPSGGGGSGVDDASAAAQRTPPQLTGGPGALLWPLCDGVAPRDAVGAAAVRLLRRRVAWRGRALRQLRVAATWRGAPTSLSTANTAGAMIELPLALALSDADFTAALGAATGDAAAAARECAAAARDDGADTAPRPAGQGDALP